MRSAAASSSGTPCAIAVSSIPESSMKASYVPDSSPGAVISSGASGNPPFPPTCFARSSAPFHVSIPSDWGPNSA